MSILALLATSAWAASPLDDATVALQQHLRHHVDHLGALHLPVPIRDGQASLRDGADALLVAQALDHATGQTAMGDQVAYGLRALLLRAPSAWGDGQVWSAAQDRLIPGTGWSWSCADDLAWIVRIAAIDPRLVRDAAYARHPQDDSDPALRLALWAVVGTPDLRQRISAQRVPERIDPYVALRWAQVAHRLSTSDTAWHAQLSELVVRLMSVVDAARWPQEWSAAAPEAAQAVWLARAWNLPGDQTARHQRLATWVSQPRTAAPGVLAAVIDLLGRQDPVDRRAVSAWIAVAPVGSDGMLAWHGARLAACRRASGDPQAWLDGHLGGILPIDGFAEQSGGTIRNTDIGRIYDCGQAGSWVEWRLGWPARPAGGWRLAVTYAVGSVQARRLHLVVNGDPVGGIDCPPTGAWSRLGTITMPLPPGCAPDRLRLVTADAAGGPNISEVSLLPGTSANQ